VDTLRLLWRGLPRFPLGLLVGMVAGVALITRTGAVKGYLYGLVIFAAIGVWAGAVLIPRRKDLHLIALWRQERDHAVAALDAAVDELTALDERSGGPAIISPEQAQIVITATADQVISAPGGGYQLVPACEPDCGVCGGSGLCPGRTVQVTTPVDIAKFRRTDRGDEREGRAHA
jgi:hypothetical protein